MGGSWGERARGDAEGDAEPLASFPRPSTPRGVERPGMSAPVQAGTIRSSTGRGLLIVVSGPSGVGKGTVVQRLLQRLSQAEVSVSFTTRLPRPEEVEGVDYHFVDEETFDELIAEGELLEWASVHRARYGTPRNWVEGKLAEGVDVLLEIDVQGALQVRRRMADALLIFLAPPSRAELARRLRLRGTEPPDERERRLETAEAELAAASAFDHVLINDELDACVETITDILRTARR